MANEHSLTDAASDWLDTLVRQREAVWWIKVAGGRYQRANVGDYILCIHGRFVMVELKHPKDDPQPSPGQVNTLLAVERARGVVRVFNSLDTFKRFVLGALRDWRPRNEERTLPTPTIAQRGD